MNEDRWMFYNLLHIINQPSVFSILLSFSEHRHSPAASTGRAGIVTSSGKTQKLHES